MEPASLDHEPSKIVEKFWIERAAKLSPEEAVHPKSRFMSYEMWTRKMLQTWTMQRVRALKPRSARTLDIGCGFGDWTALLAEVSDEVFAFDIAPSFVEQTQRRVPNAHVKVSDLRSYEMPPNLDIVYIGAVLLYATEAEVVDVLRRVRAAIRTDALVIIRDWCTFNAGRRTTNSSGGHWSIHRSPDELCWLAEAARLHVAEVRSSPSIYGEVMGGRFGQWPLRALWSLVSLPVRRASHTIILRP